MKKTILRAGIVLTCATWMGCGSGNAFGPGQDAGSSTTDTGTTSSKDTGTPVFGFDATTPKDTGVDAMSTFIDATLTGDSGADASDASGDATLGHDGSSASDAAHDQSASDALASHDGSADGHATGDAHADGHSSDAHEDGTADATEDAAVDAGSDVAPPPPTFLQHCGGTTHTTLSGSVYAPNGVDVIPSVRVYAAEQINPYPSNYCDKCSAPIDPVYSATYTNPEGVYSLNLDEVPYGASIVFTTQIGRFRKHTVLPINACTSTTPIPKVDETLPGNSAAGDIPKIVVSAGEADHLDVVLSNLGITEYDCYEGRKVPETSTATCPLVANKTIADVLTDDTTLSTYNMAFLSCAPGAYANYIKTYNQATMTANTQSWVAGGGRIFVTDTAYDYIAQAFPSDVTWAGASGTPQPVDSANIGCAPAGTGGTSAHSVLYPVTIDDPTLASWLQFENVIPAMSTTAQVNGYYEPWSAISSLPTSSTLIADGRMPIDPTYKTTECANPTIKDVPLTAEFAVPTCGRVVFSSYHTYSSGGAGSTAANEKIMEFLIFAAAVCGG